MDARQILYSTFVRLTKCPAIAAHTTGTAGESEIGGGNTRYAKIVVIYASIVESTVTNIVIRRRVRCGIELLPIRKNSNDFQTTTDLWPTRDRQLIYIFFFY